MNVCEGVEYNSTYSQKSVLYFRAGIKVLVFSSNSPRPNRSAWGNAMGHRVTKEMRVLSKANSCEIHAGQSVNATRSSPCTLLLRC